MIYSLGNTSQSCWNDPHSTHGYNVYLSSLCHPVVVYTILSPLPGLRSINAHYTSDTLHLYVRGLSLKAIKLEYTMILCRDRPWYAIYGDRYTLNTRDNMVLQQNILYIARHKARIWINQTCMCPTGVRCITEINKAQDRHVHFYGDILYVVHTPDAWDKYVTKADMEIDKLYIGKRFQNKCALDLA